MASSSWPWSRMGFLFICFIISLSILQTECRTKKPKCTVCKGITEKFLEGLEKTAKSNFGGGNTRWEEKSLGSYQFSETRFIEITEHMCTSSDNDCHNFIEEWEERIETWWFKLFAKGKNQNLHQYLCIELSKACCADHSWGPNCESCPGSSERPCKGNGKCNGAGTRGGTGKCDCDEGYEGDLCDDCKEGFYEAEKNDTYLKCERCHTACDGGCHKDGPEGCHDCKKGWRQNTDDVCEDIDECTDDEENKLCSEDKFCRNSPGSFECEACDLACKGCTSFGSNKCTECREKHYKDGEHCKACHEACESSCSGPGPGACDECTKGFVKDENAVCTDVNECEAETSPCAANEYCSNLPGIYNCNMCPKTCLACTSSNACTECAAGYQLDPDTNSCQDVDECLLEQKACTGEREKCVNNEGSFTCICMKGFVRRGGKCERKQKVAVSYDKEACEICRGIVDNFKKGIEKTDKQNFGGGNTQWEEKKLGVYATSETRLVEITEELCPDDSKDCNRMMENNEKFLEQWWFTHFAKQKETDLFSYFCIHRVDGACCPNGTAGPTCTPCPGGDNICGGHGECEGAGSREGAGECKCNAGYTGEACGSCDKNYFADKSSGEFTCKKCHEACQEDLSCTSQGADGCDACKDGWEDDDELGCKDIDECERHPYKCKDTQFCTNTVGSYKCEACNSACVGCTGAGADNCKECAGNYYMEDQTCKECHASCDGCTGGMSTQCTQCRSGWTLQDGSCTDINECQAEESPCSQKQYCVNNLGSYRCHPCHSSCNGCTAPGPNKCLECGSGFRLNVEADSATCADIDECAEGTACLEEGQTCSNTVGSFKCSCADGYTKKDDKCVKKKDTKKRKKKTKKNKVKTVQTRLETEEEKEKNIDDIITRIDASGSPDETADKLMNMIKEKQEL